MDYVNVSVTCTNCGSTVVLNLRKESCGGFCECGYYSVDIDGRTIIKNVETHGGAKKR